MQKNIIGLIVALVVVAGGSFYGGMTYGKNTAVSSAMQSRGGFQGRNGGSFGAHAGGAGGAVSGDIISKTDNTMTVKMRDGSSKIVIYSASTPIHEITQVDVALDQLQVGKSITVTGAANSDGSVTADSIQLRTSSTPAFGGFNRQPSSTQANQ